MTDTDWKARAEAAEARVKELEAEVVGWQRIASHPPVRRATERADKLERENAKLLARLTVTDEMVETAMKRILKDWRAAGITVKPELEASEIAARAALTAALEGRKDG